jgi:hypothetical protein
MSTSLFHPDPYVDVQIRPAIQKDNLSAEVVWTYLVARKYQENPQTLVNLLCGFDEALPENPTLWLETYLYPTRIRNEERNAWKIRADMAIGHFGLAEDRNSQIQSNGEWVCIAESKWFDDIHANGKFPEIYQLSQIIDHALLLHGKEGKFPDRVYVTLITPRYFKERQGRFSDRLYWEKYNNYKFEPKKLEQDLRLCQLPFLKHDIEKMVERINKLTLRWVTFEDLLDLPDLLEDHVPGKYRCTYTCWKPIFHKIGLEQFYDELVWNA